MVTTNSVTAIRQFGSSQEIKKVFDNLLGIDTQRNTCLEVCDNVIIVPCLKKAVNYLSLPWNSKGILKTWNKLEVLRLVSAAKYFYFLPVHGYFNRWYSHVIPTFRLIKSKEFKNNSVGLSAEDFALAATYLLFNHHPLANYSGHTLIGLKATPLVYELLIEWEALLFTRGFKPSLVKNDYALIHRYFFEERDSSEWGDFLKNEIAVRESFLNYSFQFALKDLDLTAKKNKRLEAELEILAGFVQSS